MSKRSLSMSRWSDIEPYFDRALELAPAAREVWLTELASRQPETVSELRRLLRQRDALNAAGFLQEPPAAVDAELTTAIHEMLATHLPHGRRERPLGDELSAALENGVVGPYRLIREIGVGGMSRVWLAERNDGDFKREVALKLPLVSSRTPTERFLRERDLLAALTHPNIARLYDAGISASGQPYLAMEYVEGIALLPSCDERRLGVRERLATFLQVLDAVQFAHGKLIIHRDLKPSNVLVTPEGRVVLLDFGIGKLLRGETAPDTHFTQLFGRALTPDYASPEQINGSTLGTASDIYSLGVILYELLTGTRPYRLRRNSRGALEDAIVLDDARRPSRAALSVEDAAARSTSVGALTRALAGDVDTIVLKALKKDPLERYASVTAFAQDISNHLQQLPVSARPDTRRYRVGRFASRHRVPVVAAGVTAVVLVGSAVLALWQASAAAGERDRAVAFASRSEAFTEFLGTVLTEGGDLDQPITLHELLTRGEQIALANTTSSPENRAFVLEQIGARFASFGARQRGSQLSEQALALLSHTSDPALKSRLICRHARSMADLGQHAEAVHLITGELRGLGSDPHTAASCLYYLAEICVTACPAGASSRYAQAGLARVREVRGRGALYERMLLGAVAYGYYLDGDKSQADDYFAEAVREESDVGRGHSMENLTTLRRWARMVDGAGDARRALELYERASAIARERSVAAGQVGPLAVNRAHALAAMGRYREAQSAYEQVCSLEEQQSQQPRTHVACLLGLASIATTLGSFAEADTYLQRVDRLFALDLPRDDALMSVRIVLEAQVAVAQGRLHEASALFARVLALDNVDRTVVGAERGMAEIELASGNNAQAIAHARRAVKTAVSLQGGLQYSRDTGLALFTLGRMLRAQDAREQTRSALESSIAQFSNTVDADYVPLTQARQMLHELKSAHSAQ